MRTRPEKRNVSLSALDEASSDSISDSQSLGNQQPVPEQKRKRPRKQDPNRARMLDGYKEGKDYSIPEIEEQMAFCCFNCNCSDARRGRIPWNDKYVHSSDDSLWHRRCCHNVVDAPSEDWLSPVDQAVHDAEPTEEELILLSQEIPDEKQSSMQELRQKYRTSKVQESEMYNEDELEDPASQLNTNEEYVRNRKWFQDVIPLRKEERKAACILDMFSGIGSGLVSLKRLGISIKKVIHVEHDKMATDVYKSNHDSSYNPAISPDGIEHVYKSTFEEVAENLTSIIMEHGPIDVVLGGPPCVDYSGVNAHRQGTEGDQGKYMLLLGEVVRKIRKQYRILKTVPKDYPVFFMAENTVLRNSRHTPLVQGDLDRIKIAYKTYWALTIDAKDFSPCRRKRTYISNIPFELRDSDYGDPPSTSCLNDYKLAASFIDPEMVTKANCFMASSSRVDDDRMLVFKQDGNKILSRTITIEERELMMGFPKGYVSKPINRLFSSLFTYGLGIQFTDQVYWAKSLDSKYHDFSGNYHNLREGEPFKYEVNVGQPVKLKLAPPQTTQMPQFYTADQYAKRLIGNAYSIPVVDIVLRPLQRMFSSKQYEGYTYAFEWENPVQEVDETLLSPVPSAVASMPSNPQDDEEPENEDRKPTSIKDIRVPRKARPSQKEEDAEDRKPPAYDHADEKEHRFPVPRETPKARVQMRSQKSPVVREKSNAHEVPYERGVCPKPELPPAEKEENQLASSNRPQPSKQVRDLSYELVDI